MKRSGILLVFAAVLVFAAAAAGSSLASETGSSVPALASKDVQANPEALIDLVIVKGATSPTPLNGIVNYMIAVTNRGPDPATEVQMPDPAPHGIRHLTASPSQGACTVTPSLIVCSLNTIAAGQTVEVAVTGRALIVGTHTNTATVTGGGGREVNPADNVDDAVTLVPEPLKAPEPMICLTLTASPKVLRAEGKPDRIRVRVVAGRQPVKRARVTVYGADVRTSARSNANGFAFLTVNPLKAGLLTVTVLDARRPVCGVKRIGVVGVFTAPLTG